MKRAVVCGAGGFIGSHLVRRLKAEGYYVRGVDIKAPEYSRSEADEFDFLDLRDPANAVNAVLFGSDEPFDDVYQMAADMGGMGFISAAECEIMRNNALININMVDASAKLGINRYLFSSSACVYPDQAIGARPFSEDDVYPANPDNEYGWEKLYAERVAMAYGRKYGMAVRIPRFQNCYGPEGTWCGGREKFPAAICRKVALAKTGGSVEVWGDGTAMRQYVYVDDLVDGVRRLMDSDLEGGVNIGKPEYISVNDLAQMAIGISGKKIAVNHGDGPVGVAARYFTNDRISFLGWEPKTSLREGIEKTYKWVEQQVTQKVTNK